jgi:hypothetical protein
MMRCGKSIGTLNWTTDEIHLMRSTQSKKLAEDEGYINNIKKGVYIK